MQCPFCGVNDDKVIDSREVDAGKSIRRRRQCKRCGKRYTTYEHVESTVRLMVVKRSGDRVPYDRDKVLGGLQKACHKRPVSAEQLNAAVDAIDDELFRIGQREVDSVDIGRRCIEKLKHLDHVAYLRFASVYMKIDNVDDLLEEIQEFRETAPAPPTPEQTELF
ncbi:MAG: transcriptional regulator NrdR [Planctomycetota bacterium]